MTFLLVTPQPLELLGLRGYSHVLSGGRGQHFGLFAALGVLAILSRWPVSRWTLALLLLVYALGTEAIQTIVPPRALELADIIENVLGIAVGLVFAAATRMRPLRPPES